MWIILIIFVGWVFWEIVKSKNNVSGREKILIDGKWVELSISPAWDYLNIGIGSSLVGTLISVEKNVGPNLQSLYTIRRLPLPKEIDRNKLGKEYSDIVCVWAGGSRGSVDIGVKKLDILLKKITIDQLVMIDYLGCGINRWGGSKYYYSFDVYTHGGPISECMPIDSWKKIGRVEDYFHTKKVK